MRSHADLPWPPQTADDRVLAGCGESAWKRPANTPIRDVHVPGRHVVQPRLGQHLPDRQAPGLVPSSAKAPNPCERAPLGCRSHRAATPAGRSRRGGREPDTGPPRKTAFTSTPLRRDVPQNNLDAMSRRSPNRRFLPIIDSLSSDGAEWPVMGQSGGLILVALSVRAFVPVGPQVDSSDRIFPGRVRRMRRSTAATPLARPSARPDRGLRRRSRSRRPGP